MLPRQVNSNSLALETAHAYHTLDCMLHILNDRFSLSQSRRPETERDRDLTIFLIFSRQSIIILRIMYTTCSSNTQRRYVATHYDGYDLSRSPDLTSKCPEDFTVPPVDVDP